MRIESNKMSLKTRLMVKKVKEDPVLKPQRENDP